MFRKKIRLFVPFIIFALLIIVQLNKNNNPNPGLPKNEQTVLPMGDDRLGRLDFDFMRLKNPATGQIPEGIRRKELAYANTLPKDNDLDLPTSYQGYQNGKLDWILRGPSNVGGRTRAIAVDKADKNTFLAAGVMGGIWKSVDRGQNWKKVIKPQLLHLKRSSGTS